MIYTIYTICKYIGYTNNMIQRYFKQIDFTLTPKGAGYWDHENETKRDKAGAHRREETQCLYRDGSFLWYSSS
jgi:hypothetical protein